MPDDKSISQLTTAEHTSANDLYETAIPNAMADTGYVSRKVPASDVANLLLKNITFPADLETTAKAIIPAINEAAQSGGGGASVIQKTMAEYTALPTSEKMNGSIYKITDKALIYCLDEEFHALKEIASADYALLSSDEKNNGTLYILTDEETTAADIPYSAGVSVADKLATIPTSETGTVTPSSIATITQSSIKKYGNLVCFSMDFKVSSNTSWSKVCDIPSDYKPPINSYFVGINTGSQSGTQIATFQLSNTGSLNIANAKPDVNVQYSLCATWLV